MIDKYLFLEDGQFNKVNLVYEAAIKEIPNDLRVTEPDRNIIEILNSIKTCNDDSIVNLQIKLLSTALNKELKKNLHISFTKILQEMEEDEISIIRNIHSNKYEFISTYDYEKGKGFYNYSRQQFDYPKSELLNPDNFEFYIFHLQEILKIIKWPIYKEEPLMEGGKQTGLVQYSTLVETIYGARFNKCLFD